MTNARPLRSAILLPIFFASGVSALLYQIVWLKYLGFVFGNTVYAASTLIAVYLAGLGIGAYLFGRRTQRNPLLVYAAVEGAIALFAAFSPNAFALIDRAYVASFQQWLDAPVQLAFARIVAAAIVLLPPTILMGGTLPLLVRARGGEENDGRAVAALYAANTFGATFGVAWAGFVSIPSVGLLATILTGVVVNLVLAAIAALLALRRNSAEAPTVVAEDSQRGVMRSRFALVVTLLMGLTSIADEVFWSRILVLHLGSSVYAYSLMLFSFLVGIALGSAVIERVIDRIDERRVLGWLELALAVALALQIHFFVHFADVLESLARAFGATTYAGTLMTFLVAVLLALVIPTAIMGATFPLTVRLHAKANAVHESRAVGIVYFFNTIGSISGSLLAGFLLIKLIGSQNGLYLTALVNLALGWWLLKGKARSAMIAAAAGLALLVSFALAKPHGVILSAGLFTDDHGKLLVFREDTTATVSLRQYGPKTMSLELNGVNVAGTSPDLIGTQKLQGHLPLMMHPNAQSVLHIGFGSGGTAFAVSRHPVKNITIAEISPEVLETSGRYLTSVNHNVLADSRVHARIADGRNYVLAAPEKFDVILSDSIHPRYAGNGSLYTRDYFELCRKRLNPNGVVSMWLPIYSLTPRNYLMIIRAFQDVFPNTTVWYVPNGLNAFTIVIGRMESGPIPMQRLREHFTPAVANELREIGIDEVEDLTSALLHDGSSIDRLTKSVDAHVDDQPAVEYESGRIVDREASWAANFEMLIGTPMVSLTSAFGGLDPARAAVEERIRDERGREHLAQLQRWLMRRNEAARQAASASK